MKTRMPCRSSSALTSIHGFRVAALLILFLIAGSAQGGTDRYDYYEGRWPKGLLDSVERHHIAQAERKIAAGSYGHALADVEFILRRFPNHPGALQLAMRVALESPDRVDQIDGYFQKALQLYPQASETWLIFGVHLHRSGRLEKSVQAYRNAIQRDPNRANAYYNLGLALLTLGRRDDAIQAADKAYRLGFPLPGLRRQLEASR